MKHGNFTKWVENNCDFNERMSRNYVVVAQAKRQRAADFNSCTSIRDVLALGKPKKKKPEAKPKLDNDDRRKINKLRKIVDDPATPPAMKDAAEAKLKGYEEAHVLEPSDVKVHPRGELHK